MKVEDKKEIYIGIIKACFLVLCGLCSYCYVNYDDIIQFTDWRKNILEPIIVGNVVCLLVFSVILVITLKEKKK